MPYASSGDVRLYFEVHGEGPPVLLAPGLGMLVEHWADQIAALSPHFSVIPFEPRGGARSDSPPGEYTVRQMAEDAAAVLDAVGAPSAHVFGMSMGGHIAQELTLAYPQRVRSLVLAFTNDRTTEIAKYRLRLWQDLRRLDRSLYLRAVASAIFGEEFFARRGVASAWLERAVREESVWDAGWEGRASACLAYDSSARTGEIRCPTLVIGGQRDPCFLPDVTAAHAARIPGARYELLDAAHVAFRDVAWELNRKVLAFLREL